MRVDRPLRLAKCRRDERAFRALFLSHMDPSDNFCTTSLYSIFCH
jgi:hypothetical protein